MEITINSKTHGVIKFLIDDEDYSEISKYKWSVYYKKEMNSYYIRRSDCTNIKRKTILLHRFIMNCDDLHMVDHINHNTLDNRKQNLRICLHSENQRNQNIRNGGSSKYKGVHIKKGENKYTAQIKYNNKQIGLGKFKTEREAAQAYNDAAIKYHGEFACLNIIE